MKAHQDGVLDLGARLPLDAQAPEVGVREGALLGDRELAGEFLLVCDLDGKPIAHAQGVGRGVAKLLLDQSSILGVHGFLRETTECGGEQECEE